MTPFDDFRVDETGAGPKEQVPAELALLIRDDRPAADPEFGKRLDAWAAAGFPRGRRPGRDRRAQRFDERISGSLAGLGERIRAAPPRRLLAPVAAVAVTIAVIGVAVSSVDEKPTANDADGVATRSELPAAEEAPEPTSGAADSSVQSQAGPDNRRVFRNSAAADPGNIARIRSQRKVERDAQITLAAPAEEVPDLTNEVIDVTERLRGIVKSSRVSGGEERARATLELAVPSTDLGRALADLSDLADVRSRSEGSLDITQPFITAREELNGLRAERASLLARLAEATSDPETEDLKLRLSSVNDQVAGGRNQVQRLDRRARLAQVSVQITSEGMGSSESGWDLGGSLDDAGEVLRAVAGIALISAAALLPLAILAALAALTLRVSRHRSRERALDA